MSEPCACFFLERLCEFYLRSEVVVPWGLLFDVEDDGVGGGHLGGSFGEASNS